MNALVDEVIRRRKAGGTEAIAANRDLLSYMLTGVDKQTGEGLTDTNIRYQILTFMIAGHETTSGALSFALYFLLKHPEIAARAYEEVDGVLGADLASLPAYAQVRQLTFISQILKEALRLWPTARDLRHPYQATTLGSRYSIVPEDRLMVLTPSLHRDRAVWGDDAEAFNPDRFVEPQPPAKIPPNAYLPFGTGQRACIGRQFALQEATLVLEMSCPSILT